MRKKNLIILGMLVFSVVLAVSLVTRVHCFDKAENSQAMIKATKDRHVEDDAHNEDKGAISNLVSGLSGTLLRFAAAAGRIGVVKFLLAAGVDVNAKDDHGFTALKLACAVNKVEVVKLLLAKGADVNATCNAGVPALFEAAAEGYAELAKILLAAGADVNAKSKVGETALEWLLSKVTLIS